MFVACDSLYLSSCHLVDENSPFLFLSVTLLIFLLWKLLYFYTHPVQCCNLQDISVLSGFG